MDQPRHGSTWFFLWMLACLFVLSMASPRLWEQIAEPKVEKAPLQATRLPPAPPVKSFLDDAPLLEGVMQNTEESLRFPEFREVASLDNVAPEPVETDDRIAMQVAEPFESAAPVMVGSGPSLTGESEFLVALTEETAPRGEARRDGTSQCELYEPVLLANSILRLPTITPDLPTSEEPTLQEEQPTSEEIVYPDTGCKYVPPMSLVVEPSVAEHDVKKTWPAPETLIESLGVLAKAKPASQWATEVLGRIQAFGTAFTEGSKETTSVLDRLVELNHEATELTARVPDKATVRQWRKVSYALGRRVEVWQGLACLGGSETIAAVSPEFDQDELSACLADIDIITNDSTEGKAWRKFLMVDALKKSLAQQPSSEDDSPQELAKRVLARLSQTPLTHQQQRFISNGPVVALRSELRRWAAEPVEAAVLLRDIERYERTGLPSDARRLALDCQNLFASSSEAQRQLATCIDLHYRNANFRLAVTEDLLNQLIPERNLEYARVRDRVLGRPTRGESLMATELGVRLQPDPNRVRLSLEVTGEIAALTTSDAGMAQFHNNSESHYIARKPLEINMTGIRVWPVEVEAYNETQLRNVKTSFDGIPIFSAVARSVAKSQLEQNAPAAKREVRRKVAAKARERIDAEVRQQLTDVVDRMNQRVFNPLNSLSLDPRLIDAETTEKRFTMRLRLAGEDQLGSHTPRPQAPSDSLTSVQIHESVLNNGIQRLQLEGRMFTLPELSKHLAELLNCPTPIETNPEHNDVKIIFAQKDPVVIRCKDNQVVLTLSIARLSKSPRKWSNFQIRAFYKPEANGRSAQLAREGVIHLIGARLTTGSQFALRGIFSRALSKKAPWELVPKQVIDQPKLKDSIITQFTIDDGWIGIALGPKPPPERSARRR